MTYLVDRRFDFVLIHWPVPHFPGIFNCKTGRLLATEEAGNYVDNLCLADRVLAETREALERAGLWDSTTLLVSADHSLREPEFDAGMKAPLSPLVPFLLKVRGDDSSVPYRQSFSSVVSKDLLLDIMRGRVRSNAEAAAWLDRNRAHASACNDCGW
jgi:arylsulfatase A-like enzyme